MYGLSRIIIEQNRGGYIGTAVNMSLELEERLKPNRRHEYLTIIGVEVC